MEGPDPFIFTKGRIEAPKMILNARNAVINYRIIVVK